MASEAGWTRFDVVLPCARWTARAQAEAAGRGGPEAPEGTGAPGIAPRRASLFQT